jgi:hypothetical protein
MGDLLHFNVWTWCPDKQEEMLLLKEKTSYRYAEELQKYLRDTRPEQQFIIVTIH